MQGLDIPTIWRDEIRIRLYTWAQVAQDQHTYYLENVTDDGPGWLCGQCPAETWIPYGIQHSHDDRPASPAPHSTTGTFKFLDHEVAHLDDCARCLGCGAESYDGSINEFKLGCDAVNVRLYRQARRELRQARAS